MVAEDGGGLEDCTAEIVLDLGLMGGGGIEVCLMKTECLATAVVAVGWRNWFGGWDAVVEKGVAVVVRAIAFACIFSRLL